MAQDSTINEPQNLQQQSGQVMSEDDMEVTEEMLKGFSQDQLEAIFVEQMIEDKGLVPNDVLRAQLREKMAAYVDRAVVAKMPTEVVERLGAQDEVSEDELEKAVEEAGLDLTTITEEAMLSFRDEYLKEDNKNE